MNNMAPDLSSLAPAYVVFLVVAVLGSLFALTVIARSAGSFVAVNHRARVARHESIPTYYRHLIAAH